MSKETEAAEVNDKTADVNEAASTETVTDNNESPETVAAAETEEAEQEVVEEQASTEKTVADAELDANALKIELDTAQQKITTLQEQLLRQQAEQENVRKRLNREVEDAHKYGLKNFALELLPIKDSMEMGLEAATQEQASIDTLREGNELALKMFSGALDKFNIEIIDPANEKFNPDLHEAMSMAPNPEAESGTVLHVHQKGYQLNGRLLRPALVIVCQ